MSYQFGRYQALRTIADGGMGQVFEGRVLGAGGFEKTVAIKAIHSHILNDPAFVAMFLDEARIAANIQHPNVVATHDVQLDPKRLFLIMDYVNGPNLKQLMSYFGGALPLPITLRIFLDVLGGLHAANDLRSEAGEPLGIVHRDLTPHNVLIGSNGTAKIADFGIALAGNQLAKNEVRTVRGKLSYLAPEQLLGSSVDRRTDIYSVGAGLWECLAGRTMFRNLTAVETARQIRNGLIPALPESLPSPLARVAQFALSRAQEDRFDTAAEFGDALSAAAKLCGITPAHHEDVARFLEREGLLARHAREAAAFAKSHPLSEPQVGGENEVQNPSKAEPGPSSTAPIVFDARAGAKVSPKSGRIWPWLLGTVALGHTMLVLMGPDAPATERAAAQGGTKVFDFDTPLEGTPAGASPLPLLDASTTPTETPAAPSAAATAAPLAPALGSAPAR